VDDSVLIDTMIQSQWLTAHWRGRLSVKDDFGLFITESSRMTSAWI